MFQRPKLPYVPAGAAEKAAAVAHRIHGAGEHPWPLTYGLTPATRLGVCVGCPVNAPSTPVVTEKNWADLIFMIGEICQSLATRRSIRFENFGVCVTSDKLKICRWSPVWQLLRYCLRLPGMLAALPVPTLGSQ